MAGGLLHIFELGAVFERRGDEGGAHRVRRVAAIEPEACRKFSHHAVNGIGVHRAPFLPAFAIRTQRPKHRTVHIVAVPGEFQIGAQPRSGLWVDGEGVAPAALAHQAQRVIAAVLVQVADPERRDLGAAQPDLEADRQQRAVAPAGDGVLGRRVEQLARLRLGERKRRAFVAIDRRARDQS